MKKGVYEQVLFGVSSAYRSYSSPLWEGLMGTNFHDRLIRMDLLGSEAGASFAKAQGAHNDSGVTSGLELATDF